MPGILLSVNLKEQTMNESSFEKQNNSDNQKDLEFPSESKVGLLNGLRWYQSCYEFFD